MYIMKYVLGIGHLALSFYFLTCTGGLSLLIDLESHFTM